MPPTGRTSGKPSASDDNPEQGRIVVGVDGSQGSLNALIWAFGEARARKIPVHAVLAWQYQPTWVDPGLGSMFPLGYRPTDGPARDEFTEAAASVEKLLDAAITKATESDPDGATDPVRITKETVEGHAAEVLLETVNARDVMVVGSRGHGGFVGAILGSVSHHVVSHSRCPVVVVPAAERVGKD